MAFIQTWYEKYMQYQNENKDPRLEGYPFMDSPIPTALVVIIYLAIVWLGPRIMRNKRPWDLKTYNFMYNLAQIIFCSSFVTLSYLRTEYPEPNGVYLACKNMEKVGTQRGQDQANLMYINYCVRLIELTETFVHILRKKDRQVSLLHVSHHILNVVATWAMCRYIPGGTSLTISTMNIATHFIMFNYYLAAGSSNPLLQKISRSFKQYMTIIQMIQFALMLIVMIQDIGFHPKCKSQSYLTYFSMGCVLWDFTLFALFYRENYLNKKKST